MNLKTANLVAVQFGMFVGMMSWLAYFRFESAEPHIAAIEMQKRSANSVAAVAPISDLGSQLTRAWDEGVDREENQLIAEQPIPVALPHQYSPEAVQQYTTLAAQQYYQQIAPRRYASSGLENSSIVADEPSSYAEVDQAPVAVQSDYPEEPQPVAYVQPTQFIAYPEPLLVFSNGRRFSNRRRSKPHPGALMPTTHRHPDRPRSQPSGNGVAPRQNISAPTCRPTQGFESKGKR